MASLACADGAGLAEPPSVADASSDVPADLSTPEASMTEPAEVAPSFAPPTGPTGSPSDIGCADGSREGFNDLARWPDIAGCAGGFRLAGLEDAPTRAPHCDRQAGNSSRNPAGNGCTVADLCALGWRVCEDAADVARRSSSGCAGAAPPGHALFFVVRAGGSVAGLCAPSAGWRNDLHGCGSLGAPAHASCAPLDRRLGFADCLATGGLWNCGDAPAHLEEVAWVSKAGPGGGGALCCRD